MVRSFDVGATFDARKPVSNRDEKEVFAIKECEDALVISRRDIIAGATTAVVLVPQALAYAMLAGLPPVMGLYSALLPLIVYAVP